MELLSLLQMAVPLLAGAMFLALLHVVPRLARVRREAAIFRTVAEEANDGLLLQSMDTRIVWVNRAYCRMMGREPDEMVGRFPDEFALPPDELAKSHAARERRYDPESDVFGKLTQFSNVRKNGETFVNQFSHSLVGKDGARKDLLVVMSCRDVTEQVAREHALEDAHARLSQVATTDWLTGIANRHQIHELLRQKTARGEGFAVLNLDLNNFKQINDTFGHAAGDAILRNTGSILTDLGQGVWCCGRMGGDEFVVLIPGVTTFLSAARKAVTILRRLSRPIPWQSGTLVCEGSIGIALSNRGTADGEGLLTEADIALYAAKQRARTRIACYDERLAARHSADQALRRDLAEALKAGLLDFHFQPTYDLRNERVRGFEALARWTHPQHGPISPGTFLPLVEEMGLMAEVDRLAARAALRMQKLLQEEGQPGLVVGFNLSAGSLMSDAFTTFLIWEADLLDVDPSCIIVEVLESTFFGSEAAGQMPDIQIRRLRAAGFRTWLDDFGAGYAGLSHLAQLQVEGLKIDRSLISRITTDRSARVIVNAIFDLCQKLELAVVAEGAETAEELTLLRSMGCEVLQGYVIAPPLPPEKAMRFMKQRLAAPQVELKAG